MKRNELIAMVVTLCVSALSACAAQGIGPSVEAQDEVDVAAENLKVRECRRDADCPAPGAPCRLCNDGSAACPDVECVKRRCVYSFPQCPAYEPCAGKACGDTCRICDPQDPNCVETDVVKYCHEDSSCSATAPACTDACAAVRCKAGTHCDGGACVPDKPVFCGGIAGVPCPGLGSCVDDPTDTCDPTVGGADCGGLCTCGPQRALCVKGSHFDSSPSVCGCVPDVIEGERCGDKVCSAGEYCCNASCGTCAPMGVACIQIACESPL